MTKFLSSVKNYNITDDKGIFLGGNFPGVFFLGGKFLGGTFRGGIFLGRFFPGAFFLEPFCQGFSVIIEKF